MGVARDMGKSTQADALSPAAMVAQLARVADVKECAAISRRAATTATSANILRYVSAGRAQEIAGHGDRATSDLALEFKRSKKTIERWGQAFRGIVLPRVEEQGSAARFELEEQSWYLTAVSLAPRVGRTAIELFAEAEERKRREPKLTASTWARELRGAVRSEASKVDRVLGKLAGLDDNEIDQYVDNVDLKRRLERIESAHAATDRMLKRARARERRHVRA